MLWTGPCDAIARRKTTAAFHRADPEAQADAIDKQIANLQDAKNGKSVDSSRTYDPWGGRQGDWNAQIAQLEKNRDNILKQIDSVQDMIRKINP